MAEDIKTTLWKSADKLRAQMDAAEYKHIVLGLIFLKFISDKFEAQQEKIKKMVSDPSSDYFISEDAEDYQSELEVRDYYTQDNVFWVPQNARWSKLRAQAKQPEIGAIIDGAMTLIENKNSSLCGKLDKRFGLAQLNQGVLGELIDLISTIGFGEKYDESDLLGEVYEYFLGQFASAEGKKGGQFYTPAPIVKMLVAVLSPTSGRVYDPCCGSGGMFVQSERFVKAHGGRVDDISIYGQESNLTTWRLAAMNLAIRGFSADLGKEPGDTFARDQFPDVKFDYVMANPPFNTSDWGGEKYESDPRWQFGRPSSSNANFAWLQHMLWKLRPGGQAGVVLANGSLSSTQNNEGQIREAMVRGDVVEVIFALSGNLFVNTDVPCSLWFLTNDKTKNGRDRRGETLFINAAGCSTKVEGSRKHKELTKVEIDRITVLVERWRMGKDYEDVVGFCKSATLQEIEKNRFILTPGRYVGYDDTTESDEVFAEKMSRLVNKFTLLKSKSESLDTSIDRSLKGIGFDV